MKLIVTVNTTRAKIEHQESVIQRKNPNPNAQKLQKNPISSKDEMKEGFELYPLTDLVMALPRLVKVEAMEAKKPPLCFGSLGLEAIADVKTLDSGLLSQQLLEKKNTKRTSGGERERETERGRERGARWKCWDFPKILN